MPGGFLISLCVEDVSVVPSVVFLGFFMLLTLIFPVLFPLGFHYLFPWGYW